MLDNVHQTKYIQVIEWTLYFGLCGLSIFFMHGVLDKFFSGKTSLTHYDVPVRELPTIVFCFSKSDSGKTEYEYGSDFKIKYEIYHNSNISGAFIKEGENTTVMEEEIVFLEKITTHVMGNCFKITAFLTRGYIKNSYRFFNLYFNESNTQEDFHTLGVFLTSPKNSYGIVQNFWRNGIVMKTQIIKGMTKSLDLKPEQYQYLETATNMKCSHESYYECISRLVAANLKESPTKCSPVSLPSLPICKVNISDAKEQEFWRFCKSAEQICPRKLCVTLEYSGEETYHKNQTYNNGTVSFEYEISSNLMTLYEEYLIHDAISMVGSVGGTLGMCIGFSFTGLISY